MLEKGLEQAQSGNDYHLVVRVRNILTAVEEGRDGVDDGMLVKRIVEYISEESAQTAHRESSFRNLFQELIQHKRCAQRRRRG